MKRISKQITGGWVDESLSEAAEQFIASLPGASELRQFVARELGRYRMFRLSHQTAPQPAEVVEHLARIAALADELRAGLELIPPEMMAHAKGLASNAWGVDHYRFDEKLRSDLMRLSALTRRASKDVITGRSGERPNTLKRSLLSAVAGEIERLGFGKVEAAGMAAELLTLAGVHDLPATPEKARAAVRAHQKGLGLEKNRA